MPITFNLSLAVPPLLDNAVWFANAAAWSNYWNDITANATLSAIDTTLYAPLPYDTGLVAVDMEVDGVAYVLATKAMFDSLLAQVNALDAAVQTMRTELRNAGLITNAQ